MTQPPNDRELTDADVLLARACDEASDVPSHLAARVLADAERMQPAPPVPLLARGLGARLLHRFSPRKGAFGVLGGVIAATCVGFWIGFHPPAPLLEVSLPGLEPLDADEVWDGAELSGFGWDLEGV